MIKRLTYNYLWLPMVALVALTSCSTESDVSTASDVPMTFTCSVIPQSRTTYGEFTGEDFGVVATNYAGDYKSTTGSSNMNNVMVEYADGNCTVDGTYYWPNDIDVHFAAYSPYNENLTPGEGGMNITLPEKPYGGYTFSGKVDGRTNWMFANEQFGNIDDFSGNVNCAVPMQFNHTLSQIKFKAALASGTDARYSLNIKALTLRNVRHKGNITLKHNNKDNYAQVDPATDANKWNTENKMWEVEKEFPTDGENEYDANYLRDYTVNVEGMNGIQTTFTECNDFLYLMPQPLYDSSTSKFPQQLEVTYSITTDGIEGGNVTSSIPLKLDDIQAWTVNKSLVYSLIMSPTRDVELSVTVQPWVLEAFVNQFSNTVSVNDDGKISWIDGTYARIDDDIVVLHDDENIKPQFRFTIAGPLGGIWKAFFVTQSGNPNAFTISPNEGPVGSECTVTIAATEKNTSNTANIAELCFVVQTGEILPVDLLTTLTDYRNYKVLQNINK